jgi:hypothetical protein
MAAHASYTLHGVHAPVMRNDKNKSRAAMMLYGIHRLGYTIFLPDWIFTAPAI